MISEPASQLRSLSWGSFTGLPPTAPRLWNEKRKKKHKIPRQKNKKKTARRTETNAATARPRHATRRTKDHKKRGVRSHARTEVGPARAAPHAGCQVGPHHRVDRPTRLTPSQRFPPPGAAWPCLTPRPHSTCGPHVSSGSRAAWLVRVAERADQDAARLGWLFCGLAPPVIHIFAIWPPQVKVRSSSSTLVLWLEWNYIIISCSIIFFCARWPMWCEYSGVPMIS